MSIGAELWGTGRSEGRAGLPLWKSASMWTKELGLLEVMCTAREKSLVGCPLSSPDFLYLGKIVSIEEAMY